MESQKTLNCQSNPEKGEQNQRYCNFLISNYITAYSNHGTILVQKQTHRAMEHNKKHRNTPMLIRSVNLQQRRQD